MSAVVCSWVSEPGGWDAVGGVAGWAQGLRLDKGSVGEF
jgi:hypothetical protein